MNGNDVIKQAFPTAIALWSKDLTRNEGVTTASITLWHVGDRLVMMLNRHGHRESWDAFVQPTTTPSIKVTLQKIGEMCNIEPSKSFTVRS